MKKSEKKWILILIVVATILILIMVITKVNKSKKGESANVNEENETNVEEYVELLSDGTKLNTSDKLKETKVLEGLEISDLQLTENDNGTLLLGTITNKTNTKQGGFVADLKIIDKQGNEMTSIQPYIGPLEAGQSTQLIVSTTLDYANAYDFVITRAN